MTAVEAAAAMAAGVARALPGAQCVCVPMADGGEGTVATLVAALGGELVSVACSDALGRSQLAEFGYVVDQGLAIIEVASACGLAQLLPTERDARVTTSAGVGELILAALDLGARRFLVGLGGSATNDAGAGLLTALGVRWLDSDDAELPSGGAALTRLAWLDRSLLDPRLAECVFELACDVDNPLLGSDGASRTFGPQKGATPTAIDELELALTRWADVVEPALGVSIRDVAGAGAAGGLGAAFLAFTDARSRRGVELVAATAGLADKVRGADWVFTGEGSLDGQTRHGKTPWGVAMIAKAAGVPVVMFGGRVDQTAQDLLEVAVGLVPINREPGTLAEALANGPANLAAATEGVTRLLAAACRARSRRS